MGDVMRFSTAGLRPRERIGAWRRCLDEAFYSLEVSCGQEDMRAGISRRQVGSLGISRVAVTAMEVRRTSRSIAFDRIEQFCFVFPLSGKTMHRQRGVEAVAGRGEVYFVNAGEPYEISHSDDTEVICLAVPCDLLRLYIPGIDDRRLRPGRATALIAPTLMQLLGGIVSHDVRAGHKKVEAVCAEMLDLMLTPAD